MATYDSFHVRFLFVCLFCLFFFPASIFSRFIHVVPLVLPSSLKLDSTSLYRCTTSCLSRTLFNGHLGCFRYYVWRCYKQLCISFWWYIFYYLGMYLLLLLSCFSRVDSVQPHRRQPTRLLHPWHSQARTLEWVAISFSNAWKWKVKVKSLSHVQLLATPWTAAYQAPPSMGFSRQEYWSAVPFKELPNSFEKTLHHFIFSSTMYDLSFNLINNKMYLCLFHNKFILLTDFQFLWQNFN